jgi:hypothetical protein
LLTLIDHVDAAPVDDAYEEPIGCMERVAEARDQPASVPVGSDAVELLAHPPAGEVLGVVPRLGQEQRRACLGLDPSRFVIGS